MQQRKACLILETVETWGPFFIKAKHPAQVSKENKSLNPSQVIIVPSADSHWSANKNADSAVKTQLSKYKELINYLTKLDRNTFLALHTVIYSFM